MNLQTPHGQHKEQPRTSRASVVGVSRGHIEKGGVRDVAVAGLAVHFLVHLLGRREDEGRDAPRLLRDRGRDRPAEAGLNFAAHTNRYERPSAITTAQAHPRPTSVCERIREHLSISGRIHV